MEAKNRPNFSCEDKFSSLFNNMIEGVALHKYVFDSAGQVVNYMIEDVNPAFENILGIKKYNVVGKLATEAYGVSEPPYLKEYASVQSGAAVKFNTFFQPLNKHFHISASPWGADGFATIFFDITDLQKISDDLRAKNEALEKYNKLIIEREQKMIELKQELKKTKK